MDKRKAVDMIYLDFNKAPDAGPTRHLRGKLRKHGVDVIAEAGAEGRRDNSLLTKRSQRVLIYYLQPCQEGSLQRDSSGVCPSPALSNIYI